MIKNIFFSFFGNAIAVVINIGLIPFYVRYLGIDSFAIISLLGTLNSIFVILDLGLGLSTNREIARMSACNESKENFSNTVRSIESIYIFMAIFICSIIFIFSNFISNQWLKSSSLSSDTIRYSVQLLGLIILFRWPISFYSNVLLGFQKIASLNVIKIMLFSIQGILSVILIIYFNLSLISFLIFLFLFHFIYFLVIAFYVWQIPELNFKKAKFKGYVFKNIKKYTLGVSILSICGVFFPILDKVFVSKFFNTTILGYYSIVSMIGLGITQFIYPITSALFPNYTKLYFQNKFNASYFEFRFAFQLVGTLSITFVTILSFYSKEILFVWSSNNILYENVSQIVVPFFIGIFFYSFQIIPTLCISAIGDTKRLNLIMAVTLALYLLLLTVSIKFEKIEYVAYAWMISNMVLYFLSLSLIKKITLRISLFRLFFWDMVVPLCVAISSILFIKYFFVNLSINNKMIFILELTSLFIFVFIVVSQVGFILKKRLFNLMFRYVRNLRIYK